MSACRFLPALLPFWLMILTCAASVAPAAEPAAAPKPVTKIESGKVIIPTDNMRRIWGELVSLDRAQRTGTFRNESTDEIMAFTVMPYAELLHHATLGDLQDYRIGERAIFRLHPDDAGRWTLLTYIQDEMNFLNNHKEYYWVDRVDAAQGQIECTDANADKSFVRQKGILLETNAQTRFWKEGQPASLADVRVGDGLRTKTHGSGAGRHRVCWEVFLDDASLLKFQKEQQEVQRQRLREEGLPAFVDRRQPDGLELTLFPEGREFFGELKTGAHVWIAPTGPDRAPSAAHVEATVLSLAPAGRLQSLKLACSSPHEGLQPKTVARIWWLPEGSRRDEKKKAAAAPSQARVSFAADP